MNHRTRVLKTDEARRGVEMSTGLFTTGPSSSHMDVWSCCVSCSIKRGVDLREESIKVENGGRVLGTRDVRINGRGCDSQNNQPLVHMHTSPADPAFKRKQAEQLVQHKS